MHFELAEFFKQHEITQKEFFQQHMQAKVTG